MRMTRRERLTGIFEGRVPDRPAVKLWGAAPGGACLHPAWERVRDLAVEKSDLVINTGSAFHMYAGRHTEQCIETRSQPTASPEWMDQVTTYHTPRGDLRQIDWVSTCRKPGYVREYPVKEPEDIRRLLSLPYEPYPFSAEGFFKTERDLGDAGIATFGLDHAMYALQRMIGSENFALWSLEEDALLREAMQVFADRRRAHVEAALHAGIRGVFAWVGPELCTPPLMSPAAFERYVFDLDTPLCERIHEGGAHTWMHCHGKMRPVLRRFADMGIDVLNPIEPPPMGDLTMAEAFALAGDRMGLEGNIESHDLMVATKAEIRAKIHATLEAGRGRRLILCPCSGYSENPQPTADEIENWAFYVEEGVRYAESMAP